MEWTDESIARLRVLWQEGLSTAEIGRRMGITKNAVVGKAHRLDLPARPSPIRKAEQSGATAQPKRPTPGERSRPVEAPVEPAAIAAQPAVARTSEIAIVESVAIAPASIETAEVVAPTASPAGSAGPSVIAEPAPVGPSELPDNIRLLRPDMPNPAVSHAAARDEPAPPQSERSAPVRPVARVVEPRRRGLTCCWPLGEPGTKGFHFCGADPTPGKPYCAEHAALAYVKLRDRRDSVA